MSFIPELFGSLVFDEQAMRERLPKATYKLIKNSISHNKSLNRETANIVANAMKDWAVEKGATHFTHWFQPMTGFTAEKHDSFISPTADGKVIMEFTGKELIQGEPDASSFPSGGLRATFEARGYTAWDPTSYAFIKDNTLCIPTAFCSYGGEALDKKTPLLRSMETINYQVLRILRLFGDTDTQKINVTVGPEQEYFLVDEKMFQQRKDLVYCGRTLFGAKPPKGQEMEDHYFGTIKPRVKAFMKDLDVELWKLGVLAKTEHNEAAPAQHELAPIFTTSNIASDHNQITMEMLKKVARQHGMMCLLHEKPFAGVNGSGKHNNWSLATESGTNLFEPGESPKENAQFLLFLAAVIKAVDDHQDLLRICVASAGNDHRLGGNEAPPAIISMFLGNELENIIQSIINDTSYNNIGKEKMQVGVHVLPQFFRDTTDRNRTSPLAFTGNKFEFRMVGSSDSVASANIMLNTTVAEALCEFSDVLEKAEDFDFALNKLIKETFQKHLRIIFNGNNYSQQWIEESERRGLLNLRTTADAIPHFISRKNIKLFEKHRIFTSTEMQSRYEILLENYCKTIHIEALTMIDLAKKNILPTVIKYSRILAESALALKSLSPSISTRTEEKLTVEIASLTDLLYDGIVSLETIILNAKDFETICIEAMYYKNEVLTAMDELRTVADALEFMVGKEYWPFPSYGDLLFSVR